MGEGALKRFRVQGLYEPALEFDAYTDRGAVRRWHDAHKGFGVRGCILSVEQVDKRVFVSVGDDGSWEPVPGVESVEIKGLSL